MEAHTLADAIEAVLAALDEGGACTPCRVSHPPGTQTPRRGVPAEASRRTLAEID